MKWRGLKKEEKKLLKPRKKIKYKKLEMLKKRKMMNLTPQLELLFKKVL